MITVSAVDAAQKMDISIQAIYIYLKSGRLKGDYATGQVTRKSLRAYRRSLIGNYDAILQTLTSKPDMTARERDILTRRANYEKLRTIGAAHSITVSRVSAIIKRLLAQP